jgi:hypothetical protein
MALSTIAMHRHHAGATRLGSPCTNAGDPLRTSAYVVPMFVSMYAHVCGHVAY